METDPESTGQRYRETGSILAERLGEHLDRRRSIPPSPDVTPGAVLAGQPEAPPEDGQPLQGIVDEFWSQILPASVTWNHPRFFTWFNSSASAAGIAAETLSAALNTNTMSWDSGRALTELEEVVTRWVGHLLGLAPTHDGIVLDGGSTSTFHALLAARTAALGDGVRTRGLAGGPPATVYRSSEAHSSVDRAVIALGLGTDQVVAVPTDPAGRMEVPALERLVDADRSAGRVPVAVVATVGSTSRGVTDPLPGIARVCEARSLWLHVDAAYGGAVAALPERRHLTEGWERADSIAVNPHKWLFVPLDLAVLFLRDRETLRRTLSLVPAYLDHGHRGSAFDPMDYGLPLGRRARAIKLWMVMKELGVSGIRARIRAHLEMAAELAGWITTDPRFELVGHALSVVVFRYRGTEAENRAIEESVNRAGAVLIGHTEVEGVFALRVVISHLETGREDVEALWSAVEAAAPE